MSAHGHVDLGHTVAGWAGTATAVLGCTVTGIAVVAVSAPTALAGIGITVGAALLTWLLHLAGWGKPSGPRPESEWPWRVRDRAARRGHPDCLGCRLAGRRGRAPEKASNAVPVASTVTG
ncbi:HGxxPAAW family protein [Streptomyces sp. NPDC012600]|uniref:HGxxPAAW family protein n=1 Tax=Streptomyces stephensoniae TaxID=3375367 RepID=A0ABU2W4Y0_9ACTN|nr:HGxxPAAW family protein [Streptomyces griseus]MDT0492920.1 HGxxPAAW family protein [Streptomyces griseus]